MGKHGHTTHTKTSPTYRSWVCMNTRCSYPSHTSYKKYGGAGVTVCERWSDFANFLADMSERPAGTTLGRKGDKGNYEPGNCAWQTRPEQEATRSKTHCKHGHEFTLENTIIKTDKKHRAHRTCRVCYLKALDATKQKRRNA
jgi:hypothetical protein